MTLLGFQMGTASTQQSEQSTMDMSLGKSEFCLYYSRLLNRFRMLMPIFIFNLPDDMIASRRKEGANKAAVPKKVSNTTRSIATSRAKRNAAMAARRGITQSSKPTKMQIDEEVQNQTKKSIAKNQQQKNKKKTGGAAAKSADAKLTGSAKAASRRGRRQAQKAAAEVKPNRKAVKAAVNAMHQTGFDVPKGTFCFRL